MSMSRGDFREIAAAVQEAKRRVEFIYEDGSRERREAALRGLETVTIELATACARQYKGSAGFKRQTFVDACGFPEA